MFCLKHCRCLLQFFKCCVTGKHTSRVMEVGKVRYMQFAVCFRWMLHGTIIFCTKVLKRSAYRRKFEKCFEVFQYKDFEMVVAFIQSSFLKGLSGLLEKRQIKLLDITCKIMDIKLFSWRCTTTISASAIAVSAFVTLYFILACLIISYFLSNFLFF